LIHERIALAERTVINIGRIKICKQANLAGKRWQRLWQLSVFDG
jgi:hypothetical protein